MQNIEVYNYLKLLYNFDTDNYYEEDFRKDYLNMDKSFKEFKQLLDILDIKINAHNVNNIFNIQLENLDPIFWKSMINILSSDCNTDSFLYHKRILIKLLRKLNSKNTDMDDYEQFTRLFYNLVKIYIIDRYNVKKIFRNYEDIESIIVKDDKVYFVNFNSVYLLRDKKLAPMLVFITKKDWSKIYKYLDIQNCYCMCDYIWKWQND